MAREKPRIIKSRLAMQDVVEITDYLAMRTSLAASDRFVDAVDRTCQRLARLPGIGSRWDDDEIDPMEARFFPVLRYPKYLVFYRQMEGGIEILRVLHGARDLRRIPAGGR